MTSPVGHGLTGLAGGLLLPAASMRERIWLIILFVVSSNAADFDFIPGFIINDFNAFHRGPTHSFTFAVVWGALVWLIVRRFSARPLTIAIASTLFYASHLVLDYLGSDTRAPFGVPLFWPFSGEHYVHASPIFGGIKHGVPGDSLQMVIAQVFSPHNFKALGLEILMTLPIVLVCWVLGKLFGRSR